MCAASAMDALAFQMTSDETFSLSKSNSHYNLPSHYLHRKHLHAASGHTSYLHIAFATSLPRYKTLRLNTICHRAAFVTSAILLHTPAEIT